MSGPTNNQPDSHSGSTSRHRVTALACASVAVAMVGMSFAAVPLYKAFCQVTGYGGTTQVATGPSTQMSETTLTMRFDANVSGDLPGWKFKPQKRTIDVRYGENKIAIYLATNTTDRPMTGTASFNVTPEAAGVFFNKIECFCFTEQTLQPGQTIEMPVRFFVDPEMLKDTDAGHLSQLTLSYTFHRSEETVSDEVTKPVSAGKRVEITVPIPANSGKNGT